MRPRTLFRIGAGIAALGAATATYSSLIERNMFTLRRFNVPVLAPDAEPLRILHISDLHLTAGQQRKQDWLASLAGTDPDLVISTGDHIAAPDAVPGLLRALEPLMAFPGAFVFGSNDYRGPKWKSPFGYFQKNKKYVQGVRLPTEELRAQLCGGGWLDLNNARTTLRAGGRDIELAGVCDPHVYRDDYAQVNGAVDPSATVHIGVTHTPEPRILDAMSADGFSLLLAGHTHGGQVCVPGVGALVTNCGLDRRMAKGLHHWPTPSAGSDSWLHVSAGLGTSPTAPVRFACPPEASILTLIPR